MKQWSVSKLNRESAKTIAGRFELPPIIATLLSIRGFTSQEEIESFLFDDSGIADPFEIKDMDKAVDRVKQAIEEGERICVYGDYDADGVTSTALLYSYLETAGSDVTYYIPDRESEGYGMNKTAVDSIAKDGVKLIVTVDNGISAAEEIAYASSLGIDTVVTDHHMPGDKLPDAVAVVDLHRADCHSRYKLISGVGVAFKLVLAIEGEYADLDTLLDNYSDLLCIGTIGDIVPLTGENRVFVKRGLESINNSDRVGIMALVENSGYSGKHLSSGNVSFTLVPRINAVGRLGLSQSSVELLTTEDEAKAQEIAQKLSEDNSERQRIEKDILEKINLYIAQNPYVVYDRVLVIDGEDWHQGVIGIVSSRIKDVYGKPCIVISDTGGVCRGSGRSVEGFDIWKAVTSCSDILTHFGGHPMAVGLSLDKKNIPEFRRRINEYAASLGEMPYNRLSIDCKLNPAYVDLELAKQLTYLQPYGAGNPTPVFQLSRLTITAVNPVSGDKHLRLSFKSGEARFSAMYFFAASSTFPYSVGDVVDIAVTLDVGVYRNTESLTIILKDIKFADFDNTVHMHSLRLFEYFCKGDRLTKDELLSIIPTRTEFANIYRYLRQCRFTDNLSLDVVVTRIGGGLTYAKLKVALEAMNELGLIALYEDMHKTGIKLLPVKEKVRIEEAPVILKLKEVYRNEQI